MKRYFLIFLIAGVLLLSGCVGKSCPECPSPSSYSECSGEAVKTRTSYRCGEETDFQCQSYTQETQCETEITLTGNMDGTIKPSIDEKVKGIIKIEIKNAPPDVKVVAYYLEGGGLPPVGAERMPSFASKKGDVWTGMLDTGQYENGLYDIMVVGTIRESLETAPDYYTRGQILVSNN